MNNKRNSPLKNTLSIITQCLILFCLSPATYALSYYIDNHTGKDHNNGTSKETPWKTLSKVNNSIFIPGDKIYFRRGRIWEGTLTVPGSGIKHKLITFGAYGEGENPIIKRTKSFSNWKLLKNTNPKIKIWSGSIAGLKNSWGMIRENKRTPKHRQYTKIDPRKIENNHYYYPLNGRKFYFRYDEGNPGKVEIGAYKEAIQIRDRQHIIIDGIDTYGPGGKKTSGSSTGYRSVSIKDNSKHITLKNMTISYGNSFGISSDKTTSNIVYDSLKVHNNGSTGIYMNSMSGLIKNCKSYDNGRLATDMGDRGGIGVYEGSNISILNNEVYRNGPDHGFADLEISIVGATGPVKIARNYVHDCIQGCIQIAEGGDHSTIAYNIIAHYGSTSDKGPSPGIYSGIRIGGGNGGARNVKILNNIIHGGQQSENARAAALYLGWFDTSGLRVQNNIFSQNLNNDIQIENKTNLSDSIFSNNIFSNLNDNIKISWRGKTIKTIDYWQFITGFKENHLHPVSSLFNNTMRDFRSASDFRTKKDSPAINAGINTGLDSDFMNNPIPNGDLQDIGAYEHY